MTAVLMGNDLEVLKANERFHAQNTDNPIQDGMTAELQQSSKTLGYLMLIRSFNILFQNDKIRCFSTKDNKE